MKIFLAADHGGFELKEYLIEKLKKQKYQIEDYGAFKYNPRDDYPDIVKDAIIKVAKDKNARGILCCCSGIGVSIMANRHPKIRAAVAFNKKIAKETRQKNNINILCLGADYLSQKQALEIVKTFLSNKFLGGRHERRLDKINQYHSKNRGNIPKIKHSDLRLVGKRIVLRPLKNPDAKNIYLNIQDKTISESTLNIPWPYKSEDAQIFIQKTKKSLQKKSEFVFGIELKNRKEVIGCIGLDKVNFEHKNAELGYWLGSKYWSQGIVTKAGKLILKFGFEKLKLHRIWCCIFSDNPASKKVVEKLGFKREGLHRETSWREGRWRDNVRYGILDREFERS